MIKREQKRYVNYKRKALEPQERFCVYIKKKVSILIEYQDYKNRWYKGDAGTIYCENIVPCYHQERKCRYSGISPSYPDPLVLLNEADEYLKQTETSDFKGTF